MERNFASRTLFHADNLPIAERAPTKDESVKS